MSPSVSDSARSPLRLFGFTFAVTASFILCRSVADAVLLTRLGTNALPRMLILGALVVVAVSYGWGRYTRSLKLPSLVMATQLTAAISTATLMLCLYYWPQSSLAIGCLYLLSEIRGCLSTILIALLLNDGTHRNSDKSRFALVNAGAPVAGILIGSFIAAEASGFHSTELLKLCCIFDLIAWLIIGRSRLNDEKNANPRRLSSHAIPSVVIPKKQTSIPNENKVHNFASAILVLVMCKIFVMTIIGYEWKVFATNTFPADEQALTAYFGTFYAATDGLILVVQLLITRSFLGRIGIASILFLLPLYFSVLGVASLLTTDTIMLFFLLTLARGGVVVRRGMHDVALQILYGWLPALSRRETVTRALGIAKPSSEGVAALGVMVAAAFMPTRTLAWLWFPVLIVWIGSVVLLLRSWKYIATEPPAPSDPQFVEDQYR